MMTDSSDLKKKVTKADKRMEESKMIQLKIKSSGKLLLKWNTKMEILKNKFSKWLMNIFKIGNKICIMNTKIL